VLGSQHRALSNPYDMDQVLNSKALWRRLVHVANPTSWDNAWLLLLYGHACMCEK
jgi:hypothetical protein